MKRQRRRRGAALAVALCTLLIVMLVAGAVVRSLVTADRQSRGQQAELQAQWLAEAAITRAKVELGRRPNYTGEQWSPSFGSGVNTGVAEIQVVRADSNSGRLRIAVLAHYPDHEWRRASAQREYIVPLSPTRSA